MASNFSVDYLFTLCVFRAVRIGQGQDLVPLFKKEKIAGDVLMGIDMTVFMTALTYIKVPVPVRKALKAKLEILRLHVQGRRRNLDIMS